MLQNPGSLSTIEGLIIADPVNFERKLADFGALGADGLHVVFDFDRTLTVKKPTTHDEVTTWHILHEYLPPDAQVIYQDLFTKYRPLELNGTLTPDDAVDWWSSALRLFVEHSVSLTAVEETFLDRATVRPGTHELFEDLTSKAIPSVILSAGVRDVIDIWARKYDISPTLVVSTDLQVNESGVITGWQQDSLVHVLNKSEATHPELLAIRGQRPNVLVAGDSMDDASMASGDDNVIRVRILDPRGDEKISEEEELRTFQKFDALIKTGDLEPLRQLIQLIA